MSGNVYAWFRDYFATVVWHVVWSEADGSWTGGTYVQTSLWAAHRDVQAALEDGADALPCGHTSVVGLRQCGFVDAMVD